eukprot:11164774-Lingulodinium_polyedra.AAC.2
MSKPKYAHASVYACDRRLYLCWRITVLVMVVAAITCAGDVLVSKPKYTHASVYACDMSLYLCWPITVMVVVVVVMADGGGDGTPASVFAPSLSLAILAQVCPDTLSPLLLVM